MAYQKIRRSHSTPAAKAEGPRSASRPPVAEGPRGASPRGEDIPAETFHRHKFEAFGLQLKEKSGRITTSEQARLGLLQAKMDDFWAQRPPKTPRANLHKPAPGLRKVAERQDPTGSAEPESGKRFPSAGRHLVEQPNGGPVLQRYVNELLVDDLFGEPEIQQALRLGIQEYNRLDRLLERDCFGVPQLDDWHIDEQLDRLKQIKGQVTGWLSHQEEEGYNHYAMRALLKSVELDQKRLEKRRGPQDFHMDVRKEVPQWETSENGKYMVHTLDRTALYGRADSEPPLPSGMYIEVKATVPSSNMVKKWVPNVRFLSKKEKVGLWELDTVEKGAGLTRKYVKKGIVDRTRVDVGGMIQELMGRVQRLQGGIPGGTKLLIGENDCAKWAQNLQRMIREEYERLGVEMEGRDESKTLDAVKESMPTLRIGDSMYHVYQGDQADCGWHGATVVANDGATSITLEAHVSKDLTAPEFHMRRGILGFVRDNNTLYDDSGYPEDRGIGSTVKLKGLRHEWEKQYGDQTELRKGQGQALMGQGRAGLDWGQYHAEIELGGSE